jgi:hypothetical protein
VYVLGGRRDRRHAGSAVATALMSGDPRGGGRCARGRWELRASPRRRRKATRDPQSFDTELPPLRQNNWSAPPTLPRSKLLPFRLRGYTFAEITITRHQPPSNTLRYLGSCFLPAPSHIATLAPSRLRGHSVTEITNYSTPTFLRPFHDYFEVSHRGRD